MASPKKPTVLKISEAVFEAVQKAMTPSERDQVDSKQWVEISGKCDKFALDITSSVEQGTTETE